MRYVHYTWCHVLLSKSTVDIHELTSLFLLAFILNPAPEGLKHEIEFFGTYHKSDPDVLYKFHFWFDKKDPAKDYWEGLIDLPFNCTTENSLFCLYKSEKEIEEGG